MKYVPIAFLALLLSLSACSDCEPWGSKADRCLVSMKNKYRSDSLSFLQLGELLEKPEFNLSDDRFIKWDSHSLWKVKDRRLRIYLGRFMFLNGFKRANINRFNWVSFYPKEDFYNDHDTGFCFSFFYQLVFIKENVLPVSKSPNYEWYKVANKWFLSTGVNSL